MSAEADMDSDLDGLELSVLLHEAKRMRRAIRAHRNAIGHELCWHHPDLWDLLPDSAPIEVTVPDWPQFLRGCIAYRLSLDRQAPGALRTTEEFRE